MKRKRHRKSDKRVGEKISVLRHESVPQKQAVAMALNMNREGRLGRHGAYHRKGRRRKRSSGRR
jgi:hypothetical protein